MCGCGDCGGKPADVQSIPYIAYEAECTRHDRVVKRLVAIIVVCIALIFASNAVWLWFWNQYDYAVEYEEVDYSQNGRGINIIGDENEVEQDGSTGTD